MRSAWNVLREYWRPGFLPIDPFQIAKDAGIKVTPISGEYSGQYKESDGNAHIEFNRTEHPLRQRFTVAHELGHHFLKHGPNFRDSPEKFGGNSQLEIEANRFAADLLMPGPYVRALFQKGITSPEELARKFAVSLSAMNFRLKNLGLIR